MRVRAVLLVWSCFALGLLFGPAPARAATFGDCAPIGTLENFEASAPPQTRVFAAEGFRALEGSDYKTIEKTGKTCLQHYALKQGAPRTTNLEIMRNYADGMPDLGFRITNPNRAADDEIFATMTKGGVESWAHVWSSNGDGLHILILQVAPFQPTLNPATTAADCAPIRALQEFEAQSPPQTRTFAAERFAAFEDGANTTVEKSGKTCLQHYGRKTGVAIKTNLEIIKNYALALPQEGWTITNPKRSEDDEIYATETKDGIEFWVHLWPANGDALGVLLLQIEPFHPSLAALTAQDCAPIRGLQEFAAEGPQQTRTFAAERFAVFEDGGNKTVEKSGKTCLQHYGRKTGVPLKTNLEIIKNYALALPQEGWTITNPKRSEDDEIYATETKDGIESWVHLWPANGDALGVLLLQIEPFHPSLAPLAAQDCAPIQGLQDFAADRPPVQKPYDSLDFSTVEDGQAKNVTKTGKTCRQDYTLKTGIPHKTNLEIIKNYAEGLPPEGWTITNPKRSEDDEIFATQTKDGVESWVHLWPANSDSVHVALLQIAPFKSSMKAAQTVEEPPPPPPPPPAPVPPPPPPPQAAPPLTLPAPAATSEPVRPDQGDFPYLPSVPGSRLITGRADPAPFYVQPADAKQPELVANGSIVKEYQSPPGLGSAQLLGLYHTGLLQARWTIVSEQRAPGANLSAHYGENGRNIWATLRLGDAAYSISVADATIAQNRLAADLGSKCHLALTGVLFDFNKSTLKPESDAVLRQVAALLVQDPTLKLEIQGHTDNVGTDAYNQPLSEARARSVTAWLTQHGVPLSHMVPRGYGKTRPIATNDTDEGRAQNRRVEIANPACKM